MRVFTHLVATGLTTAAVLATGSNVAAQQAQAPAASAPPAIKLFAASNEITQLMAKADSERKPDQANFIQPILSLAPYTANLEYRKLVGPAAVHEKEAEMFYVVAGSGTLVTGGKLKEERRTNPENLTGTGIDGGDSRPVSQGDFFIVPQNTPHWFSTINGNLVLMSFHVPRQ
jgi:mannose-6-phosphate isomerase-like protein (cupin superfamily)